jgi:hypothetical protein
VLHIRPDDVEKFFAALPPAVRKASGFPAIHTKIRGYAFRRRSRQKVRSLVGKPEAFRTGSGKAANQERPA